MTQEIMADPTSRLTEVFQGGMGVAVSNHELAGTVAGYGETGIISGTAIGVVLARRLQDGDPGNYMQDALSAFPDQNMADEIIDSYLIEGGRPLDSQYKSIPMLDARGLPKAIKLNIAGAFSEVWLAKRKASQLSDVPGPIGMNLLTKLQAPTLSALYGAILAEVDFVAMGAGIPHDIPEAIGNLALGKRAHTHFDVTDSSSPGSDKIYFDPANYPTLLEGQRKTPAFLAIVSSYILALRLSQNKVPPSGFIVEFPSAGGHNSPPRQKTYDDLGNLLPVYGKRDEINLSKIAGVELPFWCAGSYGTPQGLIAAKEAGARGIQVGSAFALSTDSGIPKGIRDELVQLALDDELEVVTDMLASPTGFPFKVPSLKGTLSEPEVYEQRERICDLGYLREAYQTTNRRGQPTIGYRCPSEPIKDYLAKGGSIEATVGRKCLCNGLVSLVELGQIRMRPGMDEPEKEPVILTMGDQAAEVVRQIEPIFGKDYTAPNVIDFLHNRGPKVTA